MLTGQWSGNPLGMNYDYAYADHLGNISAWTNASGALASGSLARYEPFGGYRTKPASTVNPGISDRGFTGHRQNNTGGRENAFGRGPNWAEVLPQQIQELSLRMFDAAGVPPSVQDTYFRVFNQYIYTGTWQR